MITHDSLLGRLTLDLVIGPTRELCGVFRTDCSMDGRTIRAHSSYVPDRDIREKFLDVMLYKTLRILNEMDYNKSTLDREIDAYQRLIPHEIENRRTMKACVYQLRTYIELLKAARKVNRRKRICVTKFRKKALASIKRREVGA